MERTLCCICKENDAEVLKTVTDKLEKQKHQFCSQCWDNIKRIANDSNKLQCNPAEFLKEKFPDVEEFITKSIVPQNITSINYINPLSIFTPNQLRHRCGRCGIFLVDYLDQTYQGCKICIYEFSSEVSEYMNVIQSQKTEEMQEKKKDRKRKAKIKEDINTLKLQLDEMVQNQLWDEAIILRDKILLLQEKTNGKE